MDVFMQLMMVLIPAGGIGMALVAVAVAQLRRDPHITIERGTPHELPNDTSFSW